MSCVVVLLLFCCLPKAAPPGSVPSNKRAVAADVGVGVGVVDVVDVVGVVVVVVVVAVVVDCAALRCTWCWVNSRCRVFNPCR